MPDPHCAACGKPVALERHDFFEGLAPLSRAPGQNPTREWSYTSALYHHPTTWAPYCSPECATQALTTAQ